MKISHIIKVVLVLWLAGCALEPVPPTASNWIIEPVSRYDSGYVEGTEIVSVQQSTLRAVLSNFATGEVDVLDVSRSSALAEESALQS